MESRLKSHSRMSEIPSIVRCSHQKEMASLGYLTPYECKFWPRGSRHHKFTTFLSVPIDRINAAVLLGLLS